MRWASIWHRVADDEIESLGSTSLVQFFSNYYLENISTGVRTGAEDGGAPVVAGQFGAWVPIGAEQTATRVRGGLEGHGRQSVFGLDHRQQRQLHLKHPGRLGKQHSAGIAGDQLPPGPQRRRCDRCSRPP